MFDYKTEYQQCFIYLDNKKDKIVNLDYVEAVVYWEGKDSKEYLLEYKLENGDVYYGHFKNAKEAKDWLQNIFC